jgi:hypothetical protein
LPAFSYDWVGGDLHGLSALAGRCYAIGPRLDGAATALTGQVASVTQDGGWRGAAASAFTTAWDTDAKAAGQLAGMWDRIGGVVDDLAAELAGLENALEQAARQVEQQGVSIDLATGNPQPAMTAAGLTGPAAQAATTRTQLAGEYADFRTQTLQRAQAARAVAAGQLQTAAEQLLPEPGRPSRDWGQGVNVADGLRALWAVPTTYRQGLGKELPALEQKVVTTQRAAWEELIAARKTMGNAARLSAGTRDLAITARQEEAALEGRIGNALAAETTATRLAAGETEGISGLADGADGLAGVASGLVRAIPLVGTAVGAGLTIYQDRQEGESWGHAAADGVVSNGAALGAGVVVTGVVAFTVGSSAVAVGAGVVVAGVAAVGVGDFVHNMFQENWQADWHQDGVLGGTVHGVADSYGKTRHDMAHLWDDIF